MQKISRNSVRRATEKKTSKDERGKRRLRKAWALTQDATIAAGLAFEGNKYSKTEKGKEKDTFTRKEGLR